MMEWQIIQGGCKDVLATMQPGSVNCVVTSPPYFNQRDYQTGRWDGGNDPACAHKQPRTNAGVISSTLSGSRRTTNHQQESYRDVCPLCGARRVDEQIGPENSPQEYIASIVEVFRLLRFALREDGVVWLNLGDSYAGSGGAGGDYAPGGRREGQPKYEGTARRDTGLKPKNLIGIPWRTALALQDDGWWLRSDVIWHKPNGMPESATDRPSQNHEYVFLLTRSPRYYFDMDAVAEPAAYDGRQATLMNGSKKYDAAFLPEAESGEYHGRAHERWRKNEAGEYVRNRRSVWSIPTRPYSGGHFATMPPELARLCVLSGCPRGGVVLDPFAGSGTTLAVAVAHGRKAIGIELSPKNVELVHRRLSTTQLTLEAA